MPTVAKSHELTDARISFVSLVDKAANKRRFLITKADGNKANFQSYGKIVKKDSENHFVTGVVYEPLTEDSQGDFMTEAEITKAAYWFAKNGNNVDIQHSFKALENASVVESWVAKADFEIEGETVKKGTWLMTVEIQDSKVWNAIEKGEITGFSMGGIAHSSKEDVDLDSVTKGAVSDMYAERSKATAFWEAFETLKSCLRPYDNFTDKYNFVTDEALIRSALEDFANIVQQILIEEKYVAKALTEGLMEVRKAGKKMSGKNKTALQDIYNSLGVFLKEFDDPEDEDEKTKQPKSDKEDGEKDKEDNNVTKSELEKTIETAIEKALEARGVKPDKEKTVEKGDIPAEQITTETISDMVEKAVEKALSAKQEEIASKDEMQKHIDDSVQKAVNKILTAKGLPSNFNGESGSVEKSGTEEHYLHGIL